MTLKQKRLHFTQAISYLVWWAKHYLDYHLAYKWVYRPPQMAKASSLHIDSLAADLDLYIPDKAGALIYQPSTEAHEPVGRRWIELGGAWGGDWNNTGKVVDGDGNHYSLPHRGMK